MRTACAAWLGLLLALHVGVCAAASPGFTPLNPARLLDTRAGRNTIDGQFQGGGAVPAKSSISVTVVGRGGVPASDVRAVVINVTATGPSASGFATVWPTGQTRPLASNLNFTPGQTIANLVIAQVGSGGNVSFYNATGSTDFVADVVGYFTTSATLSAQSPVRLVDSRGGGNTVDGTNVGTGPLGAHGVLSFTVAGRGGIPTNGVGAVVMNLTAVTPTSPGYLTAWPSGTPLPPTSSVNFVPGQIVPNLVIAQVNNNGQVAVFNSAGSTNVVVDAMGWFPMEAELMPVIPARLLDTRAGGKTVDGQFSGMGAVGPASSIDLTVAGRGGVPSSGTGAVVVNVTAINPTHPGFVTVWPTGQTRPVASNLNLTPGQTVANLVIAQVGSGGKISLFNSAGSTGFVADVVGWLPTPAAASDLPATTEDAARFIAQATFGTTDADINLVRSIGYTTWLNWQLDPTVTPPTRELDYLDWVTNTLHERTDTGTTLLEAWFLGALGGPDPGNLGLVHRDQLRQRVAFALSEIFVVSKRNPLIADFANGAAYYYDILINDAFANYRALLEDVTLSPAMGVYLNMIGNQRADSTQNIHPDENYAREVNQLFSLGLVMLNSDGSQQLSGGLPIPTYTQDTVKAFAHVFTGWNWADCDTSYGNYPNCGPDWTTGANWQEPMAAFAAYHDDGTHGTDDLSSKQLLQYPGAANGGVLVDGGTPASDLKFALDNIFNHPNVGPFFCQELIQRLVTSNPSPAYLQRVVTVFNDNGSGVRGDLSAVVRAILLDPEARAPLSAQSDSFGKLREPLLRLTHVWRAMGARHTCGTNWTVLNGDGSTTTYHYANQPFRYAGWNSGYGTDYYLGQTPLYSNSVFNFFRPAFKPPGEMTTRGLFGPEFQITTDYGIVQISNDAFVRTNDLDSSDTCDTTGQDFGDVTIDHSQDLALAGSANGGPSDPADRLVDAYNTRFMSGQMSSYMRGLMLTYLNQIDSTWGYQEDWRLERIRRALYLILSSPEYAIQK